MPARGSVATYVADMGGNWDTGIRPNPIRIGYRSDRLTLGQLVSWSGAVGADALCVYAAQTAQQTVRQLLLCRSEWPVALWVGTLPYDLWLPGSPGAM